MLVAAVNCWVTTCRSTDNVVAAAAATDGITATSAVQVKVSAKTKARTGRTRLRFGSCDHIRFMPASISLVFGPTERTTNGRARGTFHVHGRHCSGCIHQIFVHSSRTEEPRQWFARMTRRTEDQDHSGLVRNGILTPEYGRSVSS